MITVHHLAYSRSTRVLWLLEELGQPYALVRHERTERFKAPEGLSQVHRLGKAPVIEDDGLVIAESAVILRYIDTRYGEGRFSPLAGSAAFCEHEEWLQYVESTAAFPVMTMRIGRLTGGLPPGLEGFVAPTLAKTLDHIAARVAEAPYLMGEAFMLADIQMSYLLEVARDTRLLDGHAALVDYLERIEARPAFARALAAGGPMMPPAR